MILIKSIEELQKYLKVDTTFVVSSIDAYQHDAIDEYLRDALGDELTEALVTWYGAGQADTDTDLTALLPYAQRIVARFGFMLAAPNLDLKLMDAGFAVVSTNDVVPASKDRVNRFVQQLESDGWKAVEQLLRYLEKNKDEYPLWTDSNAYTMQVRNFINSAEEFDIYVAIGKSRLKFMQIRPEMDNVELLNVIPVMGEQLADEIKEQLKDGSLSEANKKILPTIRRAVANLVAARMSIFNTPESGKVGIVGNKVRVLQTGTAGGNSIPQTGNGHKGNIGESFLAELRRMLDAHPDEYPLYRDTLYVAERNYEKFENSPDFGFFVAGG